METIWVPLSGLDVEICARPVLAEEFFTFQAALGSTQIKRRWPAQQPVIGISADGCKPVCHMAWWTKRSCLSIAAAGRTADAGQNNEARTATLAMSSRLVGQVQSNVSIRMARLHTRLHFSTPKPALCYASNLVADAASADSKSGSCG